MLERVFVYAWVGMGDEGGMYGSRDSLFTLLPRIENTYLMCVARLWTQKGNDWFPVFRHSLCSRCDGVRKCGVDVKIDGWVRGRVWNRGAASERYRAWSSDVGRACIMRCT
jgi:hypothetical protein